MWRGRGGKNPPLSRPVFIWNSERQSMTTVAESGAVTCAIRFSGRTMKTPCSAGALYRW